MLRQIAVLAAACGLFSASIAAALRMQDPLLSVESQPKPWFTLTITDYRHDSFGPGMYRVEVTVTNVSNEPMHLEGCAVQRGWYNISVLYNGIPLEEQYANARRIAEQRMRSAYCTSDTTSSKIPPAGSLDDYLTVGARYDMSRPGTYEITVSRDTDPRHPEKSSTVKSNTLTIVVPKAEKAN